MKLERKQKSCNCVSNVHVEFWVSRETFWLMPFKQIPNAITSTRRPEEPENGHRNVCITLLQPCLGSSVKGRRKTKLVVQHKLGSKLTEDSGGWFLLGFGQARQEGGGGRRELWGNPTVAASSFHLLSGCVHRSMSENGCYYCCVQQTSKQGPKP
jgi:hypothetical protein